MLHKLPSSRGLLCTLLILPVAVATLVLLVGLQGQAASGAAPQEPSPTTTFASEPVATLPPGGAISGRVTNQQGEPLAGIEVSVYDRVPVTGSRWYAPPVTTTADGLYTIPWVYPAPNVVRFSDPEGIYATEAYNSSGAGQVGDWLPVSVGETLTGIDARLSRKGRVSGRVLGEDGNPTRDVRATLCDSVYSDFGNCYSAVPLADGRYVITGVTPGSYHLIFDEMDASEIVYDAEFYDNIPVLKRERALPIAVGDGEHVAHLNAVLAFRQGPDSANAMAAISGTVTNPYGGTASWYAADLLQLVGDRWVLAFSAFGSMNGAWSMREVPVGSYRLQFRDGVGPFANSWYGGGNDPMQAQEIVLTPGAQIGGIQGVLGSEVGGRLEGATRYNTQTAPYRQVTILRRTPQGAWAFYGDTLTSGQSKWSLGGVLPGVYRVAFNKTGYSNAGEWYDGAYDFEDASDIVVGNEPVTGISGQAAGRLWLHIVGEDSAGNPLQNVAVTLWRNQRGTWLEAGRGRFLDGNSWYTATINDLEPGDYRLRFVDQQGALATEYLNDAYSFDTATTLNLPLGAWQVTTAVQMAPAAVIAGSATDATGAPLRSGMVEAWRLTDLTQASGEAADWRLMAQAPVSDLARFALKGLPAGVYHVRLLDPSGRTLPVAHGGGFRGSDGARITLATGQVAEGFALQLGDGNAHWLPIVRAPETPAPALLYGWQSAQPPNQQQP